MNGRKIDMLMITYVIYNLGIGGMVYINENGDRDTDFTLLDMEPGTGNWRVMFCAHTYIIL